MSASVPDRVLAEAVDVARRALGESVDPDHVGEHLGVRAEAELIVSQIFESRAPGYGGWTWSVSLTRAPDSTAVTVNDIVSLPGDDAIVAPAWRPYRDRIAPGDLGPGDILPPEDDDIRLVPAWFGGDDEDSAADREFAREVGLGRERVLSAEGRESAAQRWFDGDQGPDVPLAKQAPGPCRTCGFMISLAGPLSWAFGVCANGMANDDGRVVALDHGCGAHSSAKLSRSAAPQKLPPPVFDTVTVDELEGF